MAGTTRGPEEGPAVADVANHFRLRWRGPAEEWLPEPLDQEPMGDAEPQVVRTIPEGVFSVPAGGRLQRLRVIRRALPRAERFVYLENQFLWSPKIVSILADKLRDPPSDDFRVVAVPPAHPNDGADVYVARSRR